jgi:uncharacterized protein
MKIHFSQIDSLAGITASTWDSLDPLAQGDPTLSHAFLHALHESGSACQHSGWQPQYLLAHEGSTLVGAMPLYEKHHSYGEYVFDWAWADAYQRHGLEYYPKWLCALPFTPTTGQRVLAKDEATRAALIREFAARVKASERSSAHVLFPSETESALLGEQGFFQRTGVQFHWVNRGYRSFDDFLNALNKDKRKKIKQERRYAREGGIEVKHLRGAEITQADWDFFYRCYVQTYREHHSSPYLTRDFFKQLDGNAMCLLTLATHQGQRVAASLCFVGSQANAKMYGRYWGALADVAHLHFELCYYTPIEYAIEQGIAVFEGGAQGEHKMARGFEAVTTRSCHYLSHPAFYEAIEAHTQREAEQLKLYHESLAARSPFVAKTG